MKTDVLSTRQVAQLLGVGEATVKRWADAGEIDCFRTPGGHRKFRLRDVTAFVHKRHYEVAETLPAQLTPGDRLRFRETSVETAQEEWRRRQAALDDLRPSTGRGTWAREAATHR